MRPKVLISAGEASGDTYAAALVESLRRQYPDAYFFGCTGPRMRSAGVKTIVDSHSLAVVGLVEVVAHIPRIWGEFQKLLRAAEAERPDLAILTDSPDFHLRVAKRLKRKGIPVVYLVAPQVWAWRQGRVKLIRRVVDRLLCLFPFEEPWFVQHHVRATYIGHPLVHLVRPKEGRAEWRARHGLPQDAPVVTLLPGSRPGEAARHLTAVAGAADLIRQTLPQARVVLATPPGFRNRLTSPTFWERIARSSIQSIAGETWDAIAHADLVLAASGTVTVEAALLGTPMVTFYRVSGVSWLLGRLLVKVPFYTMVNLVAGRKVVPELMQGELTGPALAQAALQLLQDEGARQAQRTGLLEVRRLLASDGDPMERAASIVAELLRERL